MNALVDTERGGTADQVDPSSLIKFEGRMKSESAFQNGLSVVLVACALFVVAVMARREFFPATTSQGSSSSRATQVDDWSGLHTVGHRMGPDSAALTIVEFADFECPACRQFERQTLRAFRADNPSAVAIVFRHWPLDYHASAYPAARAAECAAAQGRFQSFYELVYDQQDSLGHKTFAALADEAGVADAEAFDACFNRSGPVPAIERDTEAVRIIGGTGTPTVIANGWLLPGLPTRADLDSILAVAMTK